MPIAWKHGVSWLLGLFAPRWGPPFCPSWALFVESMRRGRALGGCLHRVRAMEDSLNRGRAVRGCLHPWQGAGSLSAPWQNAGKPVCDMAGRWKDASGVARHIGVELIVDRALDC